MLRLPTCGGFCLLKVSYAHHDSPSLWDFNSRRNCFSQYYYNISQYLILSKLSFYCVLDIETHRSGDKMQDFLILGPRKISFNYSTRAFFPMKVCHPLPVVFFLGMSFQEVKDALSFRFPKALCLKQFSLPYLPPSQQSHRSAKL